MPRVKIARKSTAIDMTAMCDVAFLLLTFFILTATARQPEPLPVDTPASTVTIPQPDTGIGTVTVGGGGKVFFGIKDQNVRVKMLENMSSIYKVPFTEEEKKRFSLLESFGVPIEQLKQIIAMDNTQRIKVNQPGIPKDSVDGKPSQLHQWILQARTATKQLTTDDMRVSIKGDQKEEYPAIKKVIDILQAQNLNKFSLITSLRASDKK